MTLPEYKRKLDQVAKRLHDTGPFRKGWKMKSEYYPDADFPKGAALQLYREGWFNDEGKGVHLETWLKDSLNRSRKVDIVLHIETSKARTGFTGRDLLDRIIADAGQVLSDLGEYGYKISPTWVLQPVSVRRPFSDEDIVDIIAKEFERLNPLGDVVDRALNQFPKAQKD